MSTMTRIQKIAWAIDPFVDELDVQEPLVDALRTLFPKGAQVEPVSVLSRDTLGRAIEWLPAPSPEEAAKILEKKLVAWIAKRALPGCLPLRILSVEKDAAQVDALLAYAKENGHEAIALASHGRSGIDRLILGSFAESLLLRSSLPVLVSNPHLYHIPKVQKILFPTDFTTESWEAFEMALGIANGFEARMVLFHELPQIPFEEPMLPIPWTLKPETVREAEREMEKWVSYARENGVEALGRLERRGRHPGEAILSFAHRTGSALIIMASEGGAVRAALLGSAVREVIRNADCPVLVWRPKAAWAEVERALETTKTRGIYE